MNNYQKLVRDNIPNIIRHSGEIPIIEVLESNRYLLELKKKLLEEVTEYLNAPLDEKSLEIIDIQEVLYALLDFYHLDIETIQIPEDNYENNPLEVLDILLFQCAKVLITDCSVEVLMSFHSLLSDIIHERQYNPHEIEILRQQKVIKNGAFKKRYYLKNVVKGGQQ